MKKNSGSYSMKTCDISGKSFKATDDNFYFNRNSADNFHPYSKKWDNVRRTTGLTVDQLKKIINLIKK